MNIAFYLIVSYYRLGWLTLTPPESHSRAVTEHRDESRDRGPPHFSFNPDVRTSEAKVLWPAVKYKQKTKAKTRGLRSWCEEGFGAWLRMSLSSRGEGTAQAHGLLLPPDSSWWQTRPSPFWNTTGISSLTGELGVAERGDLTPHDASNATKPRGTKCHCVNTQNLCKKSTFE